MLRSTLLAAALLIATGVSASAQAPAPAPPPPLAVPSPTYTVMELETTIAKPAAQVWARIGGFCDIGEWLGVKCAMTAGKDGELGAVRTLNGATVEVLVAKTPLSYTYTQPARVGVTYNLYHGTVEARPIDAKSSKLVYSLVWDTSTVAPEVAARDVQTRRDRFTAALATMKQIVESGKARP